MYIYVYKTFVMVLKKNFKLLTCYFIYHSSIHKVIDENSFIFLPTSVCLFRYTKYIFNF